IRASGVIQGFVPNEGNQVAFDSLTSQGLVEKVSGTADHYRVRVDGACNLPEFSQLPQFLPLHCQLIDPVQLSEPVDTTIGWLLGLNLASVDNVFTVTLFGG